MNFLNPRFSVLFLSTYYLMMKVLNPRHTTILPTAVLLRSSSLYHTFSCVLLINVLLWTSYSTVLPPVSSLLMSFMNYLPYCTSSVLHILITVLLWTSSLCCTSSVFSLLLSYDELPHSIVLPLVSCALPKLTFYELPQSSMCYTLFTTTTFLDPHHTTIPPLLQYCSDLPD